MKTIRTIDQKEINGIIDFLAHTINESKWKPDIIVTMAKGGLIPARLLAKRLSVSKILSFGVSFYDESDEKTAVPVLYQSLESSLNFLKGADILVVDDIADTGDSIRCCVKHLIDLGVDVNAIRTCCLFRKEKSSIGPSFYFSDVADDVWVYFPWE